MLLVDAVFINNSGGEVLLKYLVNVIENCKEIKPFYLFDDRCSNSFKDIPLTRKRFIKGNILSRHFFYIDNREKFTKVFCVGNIPPTIKLSVPVFTYFHNVSLLYYPVTYGMKEKILKIVKSKVISLFSKNTNYFIVQTEDVKRLLIKKMRMHSNKLLVIPFFYLKDVKTNEVKKKSFGFVSNGNTHKNHGKLIEAWYELANLELNPELHSTVTDNFPDLISKIEIAKSRGLKIYNHGYIDAYTLYTSFEYLVYPSLCESFGLGLIEAAASGCDIIASDLPYVYEVVKPTATFNPLDAKSIANSVRHVLLGKNKTKTELLVQNEIQKLLELIKP